MKSEFAQSKINSDTNSEPPDNDEIESQKQILKLREAFQKKSNKTIKIKCSITFCE